VQRLCGAGRFEEARAALERHLGEGRDDLPARLTLAHLQGLLREPEAAARSYRRALQAEPLSAEAHLCYGLHLYAAGYLGEAARELSRALFLDPDAALAHYFLGRCREADGDRERACLSYRNAAATPERSPAGLAQPLRGVYPDLPADGPIVARAARYALLRMGAPVQAW
jgi:chemotaxis protein methyltransferase CheR